MLERSTYLNQLVSFKDLPLIKVVTGIRRCGKSTLLELFRAYLLKHQVKEDQMIAINFEDMSFEFIKNAKSLHDYVLSKIDSSKKYYIFLDEVQRVEEFQKAVDSLNLKKNLDIYITGSNAHLLSGELATLLSGRYIEINMQPLSFKEYVSYFGIESDLARKFSDYLQFSSFPQAIYFDKDQNKIRAYLDGIYNTVILKDVLLRKKINDPMMLESVIKFLFDNIGNLISTNKIANTMTSSGRKITVHTLESYLSALIDSFIIYRAKRFDVKGKQYLKTNDKYYVCDIGLRYYLLGNKSSDMGFILENVIYLELKRRGYDVFVGKIDDREIDFVAQKGDITEYYQVALTVRDPKTLDRELTALNIVPDHFPKFLITLDDDPPANHNGIKQINALSFLLE